MNKILNAKPGDWQRVNRKAKNDEAFKTYLNDQPAVITTYNALISQFELWRQGVFQTADGVQGGTGGVEIVGKPAEIFPCTYQEWTGKIPFDIYTDTNGNTAGGTKGTYGPGLKLLATAFRRQVGNAYFGWNAAANINRAEYDPDARPGEGDNAGEVLVDTIVQPVGVTGRGGADPEAGGPG